MKDIHLLGYVLWYATSFFCFKLFTVLFTWLDEGGIFLKLGIVFITSIIVILGVYRILLIPILLVRIKHLEFDMISTAYSMIGVGGLLSSYLYYKFEFTIANNSLFSQTLSVTFGILLTIILVKGFLLFPQSKSRPSLL